MQFLHPDVALRNISETVKVAVHVDGLLVGAEERLGSIEGVGEARCVVSCHVHRLVGIGDDAVERGLLVEVQALHAVERRDLVPCEDIPIAPVVALSIVVALHGAGDDAGVGRIGRAGCVVAAQVEHRGHGVAQLAEELAVGVVPAVVPLGAPVIVDAKVYLVVPEHIEVEVDDGHLHLYLLSIVEVEGRLGGAGNEAYEANEAHVANGPSGPQHPGKVE